MIVTIQHHSQITLPKSIITKLHLTDGDQLEIYEHNGEYILTPVSVYPKEYIHEINAEVASALNKVK